MQTEGKTMSYKNDLIKKRNTLHMQMSGYTALLESGKTLNTKERDAFDDIAYEIRSVEAQMANIDTPDFRTSTMESTKRIKPGKHVIEGRANEKVPVGKMTEWYRKAQENDLHVTNDHGHDVSLRSQGTDRDLNKYWGERFSTALKGAGMPGWTNQSVESRGLAEDGSTSGQAMTPQSWTPNFVDVLLPNTILGQLGGPVVPMTTEYANVPVFTSTVSPSWIAEAGSISLDANPAFSTLQLIALGGFKDITQVSVELAQDAYIQGGLTQMLTDAVAKKLAVVYDTAMLLGVAANAGIPGLNNESGFNFRKYTGDAGTTGKAPGDTTELGVMAELVGKKNAKPSAFVSNLGVAEAFRRIPLATYGKYWDMPPITNGMNYVTSENSALPYAETDPATASSVAQSGGSYGSVYVGPWDKYLITGMHMDIQTRLLTERYIDSGQIGLFTFVRLSIRFAHPETFFRTIGVIPV
jgi:HK97 family phage major capsid protein